MHILKLKDDDAIDQIIKRFVDWPRLKYDETHDNIEKILKNGGWAKIGMDIITKCQGPKSIDGKCSQPDCSSCWGPL